MIWELVITANSLCPNLYKTYYPEVGSFYNKQDNNNNKPKYVRLTWSSSKTTWKSERLETPVISSKTFNKTTTCDNLKDRPLPTNL